MNIVIDIFSAFPKSVVPQLNLCSAHTIHTPNLKCPCRFNLKFYTKLNTVSLDSFFWIVKNRRAQETTTKVFICQYQTDNPKWMTLVLSTYVIDMCTYITEKTKMRKSSLRKGAHTLHQYAGAIIWLCHKAATYIIQAWRWLSL